MANEGSTKPTYSELERQLKSAKDALFSMQVDRETRTGREQRLTASLARVRGLLQRIGRAARRDRSGDRIEQILDILAGAESADIGELDTADKEKERT